MSLAFEDKVAIVTGAGSPIGAAIAARFANNGAKLVLADADEANLAQACKGIGKHTIALPGDLSKEERARRLVEAAIEQFGQIDVLINKAEGGIMRFRCCLRESL